MVAAVFRGPFRALGSPRFTLYRVAQGVAAVWLRGLGDV